jgi:hypothetical protein
MIDISFILFLIKYANNTGIIDKSNPLFTLAQDALEKEKKEQQHDVTQKVSKIILFIGIGDCICFNKMHDVYINIYMYVGSIVKIGLVLFPSIEIKSIINR